MSNVSNSTSRSITPTSPRDLVHNQWRDDTRHFNGSVTCTYDSAVPYDPWMQHAADERPNCNYSLETRWNPATHGYSMDNYDSQSQMLYANHNQQKSTGGQADIEKLAKQFEHFKLKPQILTKKISDRKLKANLKKPACQECVFCKNNGESENIYKSHVLKDIYGRVQCPILRLYQCPICGNPGGDKAHTIRYCPKNKSNLGKIQETMECSKKNQHRIA